MPLVSPAWRKTREYHLKHILPHFPGPLVAITPEATRLWWGWVNEQAWTPEYKNKLLSCFRHICRVAVEHGYLTRDPTTGIKKLRLTWDRDKWFTPEAWERLLAHAHPRLRLYLQVAYYTGARRATLLALREKHVNLGAGTIHLPETKGKTHTLPLHPALKGLLTLTGDPERPLLPPMRPDSITRATTRLTTRLKLKGSIHTVRHTTASHMALAGVPQAAIRDYLAHADLRMSSRYTHLSSDALVKAQAVLLG